MYTHEINLQLVPFVLSGLRPPTLEKDTVNAETCPDNNEFKLNFKNFRCNWLYYDNKSISPSIITRMIKPR
jgi:hypothetical protein